MRHLFYSSGFLGILMLLFASCASVRPENLKRFTGGTPPLSFPSSPFAGSFEKALYKATMHIKDHHLTGILFIKQMTDTVSDQPVYRFLFSNEFGMTYFDLELRKDDFAVMYCFEPMNNKSLLSVLETDFRLMICDPPSMASGKWFIQKNNEAFVYTTICNDLKIWDLYNSESGVLLQRNGKSNLFDKSHIRYVTARESPLPLSMEITNPVIGLSLFLKKLN